MTLASPAADTLPIGQSDEPIRAELFGADRLEQHAERIARQPTRRAGTAGRALAPRVRDDGRVLLQCYRSLAEVIREESAITPAAEWFVDNFHIVEDALRDIREDLPRGYYREFPKLAEGPLEDYPRVLGLAWAFVSHTDSRFEPETLRRFIHGFQRVETLTIGEAGPFLSCCASCSSRISGAWPNGSFRVGLPAVTRTRLRTTSSGSAVVPPAPWHFNRSRPRPCERPS